MSAFLVVIDLVGTAPTPPQVDAARALQFAHAGVPDVWVGIGALLASAPDPVDAALARTAALGRGREVVAADARLDRREELRERLEARGAVVSADATDTELIGLAWAEWGPGMLDHLHGDFAFVIWDPATRRLLCARDHFGGRPLFHARAGDILVVSNNLRALRSHPTVSNEIDELFVADFLLFDASLRPDATAFAAVRRLPAAHILVASKGHVDVRAYWRLAPEPVARSGPEAIERVADALAQSVRERLSEDKAAMFLSGGLDSSLVAAVARRECPGVSMSAHTMHFERLIPDVELPFALTVAQSLQIPVRTMALDHHSLFAFWQTGGEYPEPARGIERAITADLYRRATADAAVALTGDGGDSLFMPDSAPRAAATDGIRRTLVGLSHTWRRESRRPPLGLGALVLRAADRFSPPPLPTGLRASVIERLDLLDRWRGYYARTRPLAPGRRGRARAALADPVWGVLAEGRHPCATGLPLEARNPLFDLRVVRAALALPSFPWCALKLVLRELCGRYGLPPEITRRPKTLLQGDPDRARAREEPEHLGRPPSALASTFVDSRVVLRPDLAWRQLRFTIRSIDLAYWSREVVA